MTDFSLSNERKWPINIVNSDSVSGDDPGVKGKGKAAVNAVVNKDAPTA